MSRNYQLDFFRGMLLVLIAVNHAMTNDNVIRRFTYEFVGHVTAASGFVFLSGLTAGLVYTRKFSEKGTVSIAATAAKRAWLIYRNHLLLLVFTFGLVLLFPSLRASWSDSYDFFTQEPLLSLAMGGMLLHQPQYLDILPMYALFMLWVPVLVRWFHQGFLVPVLLGSLALYLFSTLNEPYHLVEVLHVTADLTIGWFNLLNWQLLFTSGVAFGFLSSRGHLARWQHSRPLLAVAVLVSVTLFLLKNLHIEIPGINMNYLVNRANLGPTRVVNFGALCFIVVFVATRKKHWFTFRPLTYLGRYSLEVFTLHVVLTVLFMPVRLYLNQLYSVRAVHDFYFYPLESLVVFFVIVPALFLAPVLLSPKARKHLKTKLQPAVSPALVEANDPRRGVRK